MLNINLSEKFTAIIVSWMMLKWNVCVANDDNNHCSQALLENNVQIIIKN